MRPLLLALAAGAVAVACSSSYQPGDGDMETRPEGARSPATAASEKQPNEPAPPEPTPSPQSCVDACEGATEGTVDCDPKTPGSYRTCARGADGCIAFRSTACQAGVTTCKDSPKLCQGKCPTGSCTIGETQCSGDKQRTCAMVDGCPALTAAASCTNPNERCIGTKCATACVSNCTTAGARRCSNNSSYQVCQAVAGFPSCLQWSTSASCGGTDYACQGAGSCVKTCSDECTSSACRSNAYYECKRIGACNRWVLQDNCPTHDAYCTSLGGGEVGCRACNSSCSTAGQFYCTGNYSYVYCRAATNGCKTSVTGSCTDCFAHAGTKCGNP